MLRKLRAAALCTVLFVTACSTPSSHTATTPATDGEPVASSNEITSEPTAAAVAEEDPIVCKRIVQVGTRIAQRICMRQSQIDKGERDAREMLGEVQKRGALGNQTKQ